MYFISSSLEAAIRQFLSYRFYWIFCWTRGEIGQFFHLTTFRLTGSSALFILNIQGRVSKVNLYQKDKDLEEIWLLYYVQGKTFKIVHDQMTESMNTEACIMVLFLSLWLLAYYTIPTELWIFIKYLILLHNSVEMPSWSEAYKLTVAVFIN